VTARSAEKGMTCGADSTREARAWRSRVINVVEVHFMVQYIEIFASIYV
jgi:hypothetical protein